MLFEDSEGNILIKEEYDTLTDRKKASFKKILYDELSPLRKGVV